MNRLTWMAAIYNLAAKSMTSFKCELQLIKACLASVITAFLDWMLEL